MNPRHIHLRNYRTFLELDLNLPHGPLAIVGDNGAGKSTIMGAIEVALFGPPPPMRTLAPYLAEQASDENVAVTLTFEHDNELYRVTRAYSAAGKGKSTLDLARNRLDDDLDEAGGRDDSWLSETRETAAATQTRIEQVIGLTRDTFRASAFLAQGDGAAFTEAQPKDRKRILADVLGLEMWERARDQIAIDRRAADKATLEATAKVETLTERLAERDETIAAADQIRRVAARIIEGVAELERSHTDAAGIVETYERAAAHRATLEQVATAARERAGAHDLLATQAADAHGQIVLLDQEVKELRDVVELETLEKHRETLQGERARLADEIHAHQIATSQATALREQHATLSARADEALHESARLKREAEKLGEHDGTDKRCDRCDQVMGHEARARAAESFLTDSTAKVNEADKLYGQAAEIVIPNVGAAPDSARLTVIDTGLGAASLEISEVRGHLEQRARLTERRVALEQTVAAGRSDEYLAKNERLHTDALEAETAVAELPSIDGREEAVKRRDELAATLAETRTSLQRNQALAERAAGRLEEMEAAATERETHAATAATATAAARTLATLEEACGRDGVPAWLVEQKAIPQIEAGATRLLEQLGGPVTRVELRTERMLAAGGTAEALDIICITDGGERDYATFSGGEKTRVNLALRISLARLLAHRRGAESRILAIDEPEFLDLAGTERLVQILRDDVGNDFDRVMLVSHVPALRDAFDTVIAVRNTDGLSEVEIA